MSDGYWGRMARDHWQRHLPDQYAALDDPDRFFEILDNDISEHYQAIRDGLLEGVNPNNSTIGWAEFLDRVAWADQTAREIVSHELIYLPSENADEEE